MSSLIMFILIAYTTTSYTNQMLIDLALIQRNGLIRYAKLFPVLRPAHRGQADSGPLRTLTFLVFKSSAEGSEALLVSVSLC